MTLRDEFEKLVGGSPFDCDVSRYPETVSAAWPGSYRQIEVHLAWQAYQAAHAKQQKRIDELEELLKLADAAFRGCNIASREGEAEPIAAVTGYHGGHCVVEPIDRAQLLPVGMALYNLARAIELISAATQENTE
jgi:hypothetical protein